MMPLKFVNFENLVLTSQYIRRLDNCIIYVLLLKLVPSSQAGTWYRSLVWWKLKGAGNDRHKVSWSTG